MIFSGTSHFVKFTRRLNEAKFWMGMTPGMIGCVIPAVSPHNPFKPLLLCDVCYAPKSRHALTQVSNPSTS